jgi:DNA-directed RNA polymerase specialized sigma24 family protein
MDYLSPEYRSVLELQLAGWSSEQIGSALGKTPAAVKMLRYRALARLRSLLYPALENDISEVHHA